MEEDAWEEEEEEVEEEKAEEVGEGGWGTINLSSYQIAEEVARSLAVCWRQ